MQHRTITYVTSNCLKSAQIVKYYPDAEKFKFGMVDATICLKLCDFPLNLGISWEFLKGYARSESAEWHIGTIRLIAPAIFCKLIVKYITPSLAEPNAAVYSVSSLANAF